MDKYLFLNHMEEIDDGPVTGDSRYYMPNHHVISEFSITTKLRVVLDQVQILHIKPLLIN